MPPTILPYVQAVKRAPVAKTPAADAGLGEWIDGPKRPLCRRVHPHELRHTAAKVRRAVWGDGLAVMRAPRLRPTQPPRCPSCLTHAFRVQGSGDQMLGLQHYSP
jgi:hypothetical protein